MRNKISTLIALSAMCAMSSGKSATGTNDGSYGHGIPDEKPKVIPKGCKEYTFYGFTVVALNRKSAKKKAAKLANNVDWRINQ